MPTNDSRNITSADYFIYLVTATLTGAGSHILFPPLMRLAIVALGIVAVTALPNARSAKLRWGGFGAAAGAVAAASFVLADPKMIVALKFLGMPPALIALLSVALVGLLVSALARSSGAATPIASIAELSVDRVAALAVPLAILTAVVTAVTNAEVASGIVGTLTAGLVSLAVSAGIGIWLGHIIGGLFVQTSNTTELRDGET